MSCSAKFSMTLLFVGVALAGLGNTLLPARIGSTLILVGFVLLVIVLLSIVFPRVFFYTERKETNGSHHKKDSHPERQPMMSMLSDGSLLIAVAERRYRMWRAESGEVACQEIDIHTGRRHGDRITKAEDAIRLGIPARTYKRYEKLLREDGFFL